MKMNLSINNAWLAPSDHRDPSLISKQPIYLACYVIIHRPCVLYIYEIIHKKY